MSRDWRTEGVRVVPRDALDTNTPQTPGMHRAAAITILGLSATPEFLLGTLAVLFFSVQLRWLPAVAYVSSDASWTQTARGLVLPVATLVLVVSAQIARMTRAIIGNLLGHPFIEMAVINAVGPLANVIALNIAYLVSGVVVVETIFAYPGLARLMVDAVQARDLPVVQACAMIFCATYIVLILVADLLAYAYDPRAGVAEGKVVH